MSVPGAAQPQPTPPPERGPAPAQRAGAAARSTKPPPAPALPPPQPDTGPPPPSGRPLRTLTFLAAIALLATAVGGLYLSFGLLTTPLWVTAGFEVVALVAALFALGTALGRHDSGFAMALFSTAVCAVVTAGFGLWLGALPTLRSGVQTGQAPAWAADATRAVAGARAAVAAALLAIASAAVLTRSAHSGRFLLRAAALGVPAVIVGVALWKLGGFAWLTTPQKGVGDIFRVVGLIMGGLSALVVAAVTVHYLIRAYEMGRPGARPELP
jgi:hypothetical protein